MYQNTIFICILYMAKIDNIPPKNADFSKNQGVCHVIYIVLDLF